MPVQVKYARTEHEGIRVDIMSKMSVYCVAEISTEGSMLTSQPPFFFFFFYHEVIV